MTRMPGVVIAASLVTLVGCKKSDDDGRERDALAKANVTMVAGVVARYRDSQDGGCPPDLGAMRDAGLVDTPPTDPWGNAYAVKCSPDASETSSAGPDKQWGTADDISKKEPYELPKSLGERMRPTIMSQTSIGDVLRLAVPHVENGWEFEDGKRMILWWSNERLTWDALSALPETTFGQAKKDIAAERGKRICLSAQVVDISKNANYSPPIYVGISSNRRDDIISFFAIGSTDGIVQRSRATFCGVLTGTHDYENSGGGWSHSLVAIGMFDLPANRARKYTPSPASSALPAK